MNAQEIASLSISGMISEEDYIRQERDAVIKSEFFRGRVYAMAGGTPEHSEIAANTIREVGNALEGRPCSVYTSDLRIRVEASGFHTYPDVSVVCGPKQFAANDPLALTNPVLLVEVLSPSTTSYDRTAKFELYKQIPDFTDYLLIASDRIHVEHFSRLEANRWVQQVAIRRDAQIFVTSLHITLSVERIYQGLDLPDLNLLPDHA